MNTTSRNPLIFIFVTRLLDSIGFGIIMPVLPKLLVHLGEPNIAAAAQTAGYLLGTYAVFQFFCGPVVGNLSDQFGRRPVILASLFAYGFDYLLMSFAPTVAWLFIGRAVAGMAGAVYVPANAYVADVTAPENRARAFGMVGAAFGVGFVVGPAVGGLLGDAFGARAPFFAASALAGANFLFGVFVLPESLPQERRRAFDWKRANPFGTALALRRFPRLLGFAAVMLLYLLGNNVYPSTWAFFTSARFAWSPKMIGASLAATGVAMATVQFALTGRLVKWIGERRAAVLGLGTGSLACLAYAFAPFAWVVFAIMFVGALQAIAYPSLNALLSREVAPDQQGELQGAVASLASLAAIFGPLTMTQTLARFSMPGVEPYFPGAAFVLAAALNVAALLLLLSQMRTEPVQTATATAQSS